MLLRDSLEDDGGPRAAHSHCRQPKQGIGGTAPPGAATPGAAHYVLVACDKPDSPVRATEALVVMLSAVSAASSDAPLKFTVLTNPEAQPALAAGVPRPGRGIRE